MSTDLAQAGEMKEDRAKGMQAMLCQYDQLNRITQAWPYSKPQTIRQSVITNLLKSGNDLRIVQTFVGHKYPSATERYRQSNVEELEYAVLKYHPLG